MNEQRRERRATCSSVALMGLILLGFVPLACAQKKTTTKTAQTTTAPDAGSTHDAGDGASATPRARAAWLDAIDVGDALSDEALVAIERGDWSAASTSLKGAKLDAPNARYKLMTRAYVFLQTGEHEACLSDVSAALATPGLELFTSDLNAWGAECAFALTRWADASSFAAQVSPKSDVHERALYLLGMTLVEAGTSSDIERAAQIFAAYLKTYPTGKHAELARFGYAKVLEKLGKSGDAAKQYNDVVTYHPLSSEVPLALRELGRVKTSASKSALAQIEATSDTQRINKLRALFKRHRSDEVIEHGTRYLKSFKRGGELYCETQYLMGKSLTKLRKHTDSITYYETIIKRCGSSEWVVKSYYLAGRGLWNAGNRKDAKKSFEKLWKAYPSHSYADDAMLYAARIAKSEDDKKEMRKILKRQIKTYPKGDMISDARWLLMQDLYVSGDHEDVVAFARDTPSAQGETLYTRGRLDYFAGRSSETLKNPEQAQTFYEKVVKENPLGYYALLAMNRLAKLAGSADVKDLCSADGDALCAFVKRASMDALKANAVTAIEVPAAMKQDESFERGGVLLKLGLDSLAKREFRDLSARYSSDESALWALAMLLDSAGAYPFSHDIPRRKIKDWEVGYPVQETEQFWKIAYPRPFEQDVLAWADKREIPSEVVWAIMREESGFNPRVESWANARGLLQLMEGTAASMAKKEELAGFDKGDLFEVDKNLRLGTAYIKELSDTFDAHPALIIAGYNGGAGNVNNWLEARGEMDLDLWIEEIPYGQTRDYTKRVLTSFWTYGWLYDGGKTPALSFTLPKGS